MTQNIYDDEGFFQGYSQLPRSISGLDGAPEWPSLQSLLPDLRGRRVLDLGCGFGWFCRWAREAGAASVLGVDVSERMLARAKAETMGVEAMGAETKDPTISYLQADLEHLDLQPASIDLAYSSLAFHYLENLGALLGRVQAALAPGGKLVFSVEHPIYTAPSNPGWSVDAAGHATWPVDGYLDEGRRSTDWLAKGVIKQHRMTGTYIDLLRQAGFTLTRLIEWAPSPEQIAEHPDWANERQRPFFLLVACDR